MGKYASTCVFLNSLCQPYLGVLVTAVPTANCPLTGQAVAEPAWRSPRSPAVFISGRPGSCLPWEGRAVPKQAGQDGFGRTA